MASKPELITIVGPTASGKSSLALRIAERWNGEIICADSRTVYIGMDIGTAKPTAQEQARVSHWGLDLVEPDEPFTVADFKVYADTAIADIQARGKLPILVGGTGLYIDSVLYDYTFGGAPDQQKRKKLEQMSVEKLHAYCNENNIILPENAQNKRHLVRAIERKSVSGISKTALPRNYYIVGIATNKETLRTRILTRSEHMVSQDVAQEATMLGKKYGWSVPSMTGNIYPIMQSYLSGDVLEAEVIEKNATLDIRLAKRQMTWFRRNPDIEWVTLTGAEKYIQSLLARE